MKILSFNTSSVKTSVAFSVNQKVISYQEDSGLEYMHAESLIPMITKVLKDGNVKYADLDCVSCLKGPGSFTGIRVGIAAAQGIQLCTRVKVVLISNFEMINFRIQSQISQYKIAIILIKASASQIYLQTFYNNNVLEVGNPLIVDIQVALQLIFEAANSGLTVCAGDAIDLVYWQIIHLPNLVILPRFANIKASNISRYITLKSITEFDTNMEPLYIYNR